MSKGSDNLKKILIKFFSYYDIKVEEEKYTAFGLRFDFYVQTEKPIAFEFDGIQHSKMVGFFHKDIETYEKSIGNDKAKNSLEASGKIILLRFDDETITFSKLQNVLRPHLKMIERSSNADIRKDKCKGTKPEDRKYIPESRQVKCFK